MTYKDFKDGTTKKVIEFIKCNNELLEKVRKECDNIEEISNKYSGTFFYRLRFLLESTIIDERKGTGLATYMASMIIPYVDYEWIYLTFKKQA